MLTIENITKLYRMDIGEWRIGKVETLPSAYLFHLYKLNKLNQIQVNLERNPIGVQYELWCWDSYQYSIPNTSVPKRRMLDKSKLQTPELLTHQIKELVHG